MYEKKSVESVNMCELCAFVVLLWISTRIVSDEKVIVYMFVVRNNYF